MAVSQKSQSKHIQYALLSRTLARVVKVALQRVIQQSEQAVLQVSVQLQGMSQLSAQQKDNLSIALEHYYESEESNQLKSTLNDVATLMMEAAQRGDMAEVERLSQNPKYQSARKKTKKLHDSLQTLMANDAVLHDLVAPVLVALQFQDTLRQELESVNRSFDQYFEYIKDLPEESQTENEPNKEFWLHVARNFTSIEARKAILKTALGEDSALEEEDDIRETSGGDGVFF